MPMHHVKDYMRHSRFPGSFGSVCLVGSTMCPNIYPLDITDLIERMLTLKPTDRGTL